MHRVKGDRMSLSGYLKTQWKRPQKRLPTAAGNGDRALHADGYSSYVESLERIRASGRRPVFKGSSHRLLASLSASRVSSHAETVSAAPASSSGSACPYRRSTSVGVGVSEQSGDTV